MSIEQSGEQLSRAPLFKEISRIYGQRAVRMAEAERRAQMEAADFVEHLSLDGEPHAAAVAAVLFDIYPQIENQQNDSHQIIAAPEYDVAAFAEAVWLAGRATDKQYVAVHQHTMVTLSPDVELDEVRAAFGVE